MPAPRAPTANEIEAHVRAAVGDYLGLPTAGWDPAAFAESMLGVAEEGGPNKGPPDVLYNLGLDDGSAWCALAVMAWFMAAGRTLHVTASQWWRWRSASSLAASLEPYRIPVLEGAARNDIGRVGRSGGSGSHVFLITANIGDGQVACVEGNVGDRTVLRTRRVDEIGDIYRPPATQ